MVAVCKRLEITEVTFAVKLPLTSNLQLRYRRSLERLTL